MTSIFQRALGSDFDRLHPRLRERFGVSVTANTACIGQGVMDEVWTGRKAIRPFLKLGASRNILFPEYARDVSFTIENFPYRDGFGRETVTFVRTFEFPERKRRRRFDATMIYSDRHAGIVDYLGTHQHLAVDLRMWVDDSGGLHIRSGQQRFRERQSDFRVPAVPTGTAELYEHFDEQAECFRINVSVSTPALGRLFGYRGHFTTTTVDTTLP